MSITKLLNKVKLSPSELVVGSGRRLVWSEYGDPNGFPIIHFHGATACRLEGLGQHSSALKNNFRIIAVDRPGHGQSTLLPMSELKEIPSESVFMNEMDKLTFQVYSKDTEDLINHLNIKNGSFGISGTSQGGPFALAHLRYLKHLNPKFGGIYCGVPLTPIKSFKDPKYKNIIPINIKYSMKYQIVSKYMNKYYYKLISKNFDKFMKMLKNGMVSEDDVKLLNSKIYDEETNEAYDGWYFFSEMIKFGIQQGWYGMEWSNRIVFSNPNSQFDLKDIQNNNLKIFMFHGASDKLIPIEWVRLFYDDLKNKYGLNVELKEFENEGHCFPGKAECVDIMFDHIKNACNIK